jgi:hypothetical protein
MTELASSLLILADFDKIISVIGALALLVFWVIGQMTEANKRKAAAGQPQPRQPLRPPTRPGQRQPQGQGLPADQADPLRQEMDAYLRQAGEQPRAKAGQRRPASSIEVLVDEAQGAAEPSRPRRPKPPVAPSPATAHASKLEQVKYSFGSKSLRQRESHLGEQVALADDKVEAHLHATFDHELGRLRDTHSEDAYRLRTSENPVAGQIANMLKSPAGVRQAIILSEILSPPVDRWE